MFNCIECGEQIKSPALTGQWDCLKCHDEFIAYCRNKTNKGELNQKKISKKSLIIEDYKNNSADTKTLMIRYDTSQSYVCDVIKEYRNREELRK